MHLYSCGIYCLLLVYYLTCSLFVNYVACYTYPLLCTIFCLCEICDIGGVKQRETTLLNTLCQMTYLCQVPEIVNVFFAVRFASSLSNIVIVDKKMESPQHISVPAMSNIFNIYRLLFK